MLHLIPFWALPSLEHFEVRTSPGLAQWAQARRNVPRIKPRLTAVGNPTLDLALADVEAEMTAWTMASRGFEVGLLNGSDAEEDAIRDSLKGSGFFHFAGHGMSRPMQPLASALLAHPPERFGWPVSGDPMAPLASDAEQWIDRDDGTRYTDTPEGRLIEYLDDENAVTERQLEYSDRGSLWAGYEDGYLVQLAELWTTADILVDDAFADCAVAFLGACESGQAALRVDVDEAVGLPSALTIAGVGTIIATLWPVGDVTALVYARLLYRRLALQSPGEFDLAALVRACRRELGRLKKDEVIDLLSELRDKTESKRSAAELDFVLQEIREGPDVPFGHPFHWAAFFSVGSARVELMVGSSQQK